MHFDSEKVAEEVVNKGHPILMWLAILLVVFLIPAVDYADARHSRSDMDTFVAGLTQAIPATLIAEADQQVRIFHANRRAAKLLGASSTSQLERHVPTDFVPEEFKQRHLEGTASWRDSLFKRKATVNCTVKTLDGRMVPVMATIRGVEVNGQKLFVVELVPEDD